MIYVGVKIGSMSVRNCENIEKISKNKKNILENEKN